MWWRDFGTSDSISGPINSTEEDGRGDAQNRLGDLSQRVQVENQDELGELAVQINHTAEELARR